MKKIFENYHTQSDPDKGYISRDEYRNEYEGKDYELLPAASMTLTQGFVFDAAGTNTFEISTVDASEILGASQYELTDHPEASSGQAPGNVRIAMVNEPTSITFATNLENSEGGGFENVSETRHHKLQLHYRLFGSMIFNPLMFLKSLSLVIRVKLWIIAVAATMASGVFIFLRRLILTH